MSVSSVAIQFTIIDLLSKGVDRIRSRMAALAKGNKSVQQSFDRMARSAKYAAVAGIATRELYKGLKPAVKAAGELQAEMLGARAELAGSAKNVRALEEGLKKVRSTAFDVQAWTPFDQGQIVALEKQLLKSGGKIAQITGQQGAAAAAAALGTYEELDPVQMGKNLIGIATPFKMQAGAFMSLADEISRAASASTVGAAEIAETAKYAAPAMSQLGRSTHEMLVLSAMLAQRGIDASMAGTGLRQFFNSAAKHKVFRDAAGNLKPLAEITSILDDRLKNLGEAEQLEILTKIFDVRGAPVAMALMETGAASFDQIEETMRSSLPLSEKLRIKMLGLDAQWTSLKGTSRSTLASLYQPALAPLTALVGKMNEFVAAIGKAAQGSDKLSKAVSGISLGGVAAGGLATIGLGAGALYYGRKVLKGVGGIRGLISGAGSAAAGIATGKAVEAATGVQPVFVTNWPANFGSGVPAVGAGAGMRKWIGKSGLNAIALAASAAAGAGAGLLGDHNWGRFAHKLTGGKYGGIGFMGDMIYDLTHTDDGRWRVLEMFADQEKRPIQINNQISIDHTGTVTSQTDNMNTTVNTALRRGEFGGNWWATATQR